MSIAQLKTNINKFKNSCLMIMFIFLSNCSSTRTIDSEIEKSISEFPKTSLSTFEFAHEQLSKNNLNSKFIELIEKKYLAEIKSSLERDKIIHLNILGFLNPGDYSKHFSKKSLSKIQKFISQHLKTLNRAEKEFEVPKEVIASLLWVETRHGKMVGTFTMPTVFFSLLQAKHPDVAKNTILELNNRKPSSNSTANSLTQKELNLKTLSRILNKSNWALEQLQSMEKIYLQAANSSSRDFLFNSPASFAGAFGCSQFIPSSFQKYAVSSRSNYPDLFNINDCIYSVGNFLKKSGWNNTDTASQSNALFEYNRIRDYGDVILKLASAVKSKN